MIVGPHRDLVMDHTAAPQFRAAARRPSARPSRAGMRLSRVVARGALAGYLAAVAAAAWFAIVPAVAGHSGAGITGRPGSLLTAFIGLPWSFLAARLASVAGTLSEPCVFWLSWGFVSVNVALLARAAFPAGLHARTSALR